MDLFVAVRGRPGASARMVAGAEAHFGSRGTKGTGEAVQVRRGSRHCAFITIGTRLTGYGDGFHSEVCLRIRSKKVFFLCLALFFYFPAKRIAPFPNACLNSQRII